MTITNVLPVFTQSGNHNTLQNHLDTLLDVATAQDKNLAKINKAYTALNEALLKGAKGERELTKTQLDCIKIILAEHKHLNKQVAEIEELIKKVRAVEKAQREADTPQQPEQEAPQQSLTLAQLLERDKKEGK